MAATLSNKRKGVVRLLRAAAELIREHGWVRGKYGTKDCGFCVMGALIEADPHNGSGIRFALAQECLRASITYSSCVVDFNDSRRTCRGDVLRLFKKAESKVPQLVN